MTHNERIALLAATEAQAIDPVDQDTRRRQYGDGYAAQPREEPFDSAKPRQWRMGWLLAHEGDEVMRTHTYQTLVADVDEAAYRTLDSVVEQLTITGEGPAYILARVLAACGVDHLYPELVAEVDEVMAERAAEDGEHEDDEDAEEEDIAETAKCEALGCDTNLPPEYQCMKCGRSLCCYHISCLDFCEVHSPAGGFVARGEGDCDDEDADQEEAP